MKKKKIINFFFNTIFPLNLSTYLGMVNQMKIELDPQKLEKSFSTSVYKLRFMT
jgi:hypothetical protein